MSDESEEQIWEDRAVKFCSEGGTIGSSQREVLWQVVEGFRGCLLYTSRCV